MSGFCIFLGYSSQHTFISFFFWMSSMAMNMAYKFSDIFKVCNDGNEGEYGGNWEALGDCYPQGGVKTAWKEFGYHHRILSGEQLVFTKKYEKIIWNVNTKWEHIVMGSFWFGDTHQRKYFQGVPLLVTIITATMDNFGSCESTLPNIGRYSCFIRLVATL